MFRFQFSRWLAGAAASLAVALMATAPITFTPSAQANAEERSDEDVSSEIAAAIKLGKVIVEVVGKSIMSAFSEHRRITPIPEVIDGETYQVMYVPMINSKSRCSLNWSKQVFNGERGRVRVELVNVPESWKARVWVQGKGDKQMREDQDREEIFNLRTPVELDWGPGHGRDRAFYFAERNGFDAGELLSEHPAAAFKITVLKPRQ